LEVASCSPSSQPIAFQAPFCLSVGVVEPLERSLSARAQPALAHRVLRIPLDLDGAAFTRLDQQAATDRALAAGAGVPVGHPRHDVVGGDQVGDQAVGPGRRAAGGGTGDTDADQPQEIATVEDDGIGHAGL